MCLSQSEETPESKETGARLLDELCSLDRCSFHGSAMLVAGVTHDSYGFKIGPEPGQVGLTIFIESPYTKARVRVLAAGRSVRSDARASIPVSETPRWHTLATVAASDTTVVVAADGAELFVYDVHVTMYEPVEEVPSCSVAGPIGLTRRRRESPAKPTSLTGLPLSN
jgi:hypothetical protein